jgi:tRNA pseudouridine38-40 synthase
VGEDDAARRTIKLVVEYDGTELAGWQRQKNGPSVQAHLERCLEAMASEPVEVVGASRTDAGVHALGQVAHFRTRNHAIPDHGFRRGLNSLLPPAIAVVAASEVGPDFHARFCAKGKRYVYQVLARPDRSPLSRARAWHRPRALDLERMRRAAPALVGRHDFSAFRAAGCGAAHAVRRVTGIDIRRDGALVAIEVRGEAFLRNMVRIIAGTLVEIGENRRDPDEIPRVLGSRDRREAGITAPAHGLTLVEVIYGSGVSCQGS